MKYEDYVNLNYRPSKKDLIVDFFVEGNSGQTIKKVAGAVASESSTGTWTEISTEKKYMHKLSAKVFSIKKVFKNSANIKIAYPNELFEPGNLANIMSSVAGNIFGMKGVKNLRMNDIHLPLNIAKSFLGPKYGISGIRKLLKIKKRPLIGTIVKPKVGLRTSDHAKVAYDAWRGGCDMVKDDENLSSQSFNKFDARLSETLKMKHKAEKETGEKKVYMINITAETSEMIKRAKKVVESGNEYLMVDIITSGWSALQTLRNQNFKLVHHAHRAGHAAFDRSLVHGINMKVISRLSRTIGMDQLHIGTAGVGKMVENKRQSLDNVSALVDNYYGIKKTMPVASGGLNPCSVPELYKIFRNNVIIQMGGGIHGHPLGTFHGAKAARQALDATISGISLKEYAKEPENFELNQAIRKWK